MIWTVTLPWPPKGLQPHAKGHWRPKAVATKQYRQDAFWAACEAKVKEAPGATLTFAFHPPDLRRRDCQNMPIPMKPAIDGIADAMECDDHEFRCVYPSRFDEPVRGGRVVVTIDGGEPANV